MACYYNTTLLLSIRGLWDLYIRYKIVKYPFRFVKIPMLKYTIKKGLYIGIY